MTTAILIGLFCSILAIAIQIVRTGSRYDLDGEDEQ
jgi:uncharacterized membrane protein